MERKKDGLGRGGISSVISWGPFYCKKDDRSIGGALKVRQKRGDVKSETTIS